MKIKRIKDIQMVFETQLAKGSGVTLFTAEADGARCVVLQAATGLKPVQIGEALWLFKLKSEK